MNLEQFYASEGPERCGFVLMDGSLLEVANLAGEPEKGFEIDGAELLARLKAGDTAGTWHTHPGASANLSMADYRAFLAYPSWSHFIVGDDGVRRFYVEEGAVLCEE